MYGRATLVPPPHRPVPRCTVKRKTNYYECDDAHRVRETEVGIPTASCRVPYSPWRPRAAWVVHGSETYPVKTYEGHRVSAAVTVRRPTAVEGPHRPDPGPQRPVSSTPRCTLCAQRESGPPLACVGLDAPPRPAAGAAVTVGAPSRAWPPPRLLPPPVRPPCPGSLAGSDRPIPTLTVSMPVHPRQSVGLSPSGLAFLSLS